MTAAINHSPPPAPVSIDEVEAWMEEMLRQEKYGKGALVRARGAWTAIIPIAEAAGVPTDALSLLENSDTLVELWASQKNAKADYKQTIRARLRSVLRAYFQYQAAPEKFVARVRCEPTVSKKIQKEGQPMKAPKGTLIFPDLRSKRLAANLSVREFASLAGVGDATIYRLEGATGEVTRESVLSKVKVALDGLGKPTFTEVKAWMANMCVRGIYSQNTVDARISALDLAMRYALPHEYATHETLIASLPGIMARSCKDSAKAQATQDLYVERVTNMLRSYDRYRANPAEFLSLVRNGKREPEPAVIEAPIPELQPIAPAPQMVRERPMPALPEPTPLPVPAPVAQPAQSPGPSDLAALLKALKVTSIAKTDAGFRITHETEIIV